MQSKLLQITISSLMLGGAWLAPQAAFAGDEMNDRNLTTDIPANGRGNHSRLMPPKPNALTGAVTQGNGIIYHNGPVMHSGVNIYYIWYGNWAQDAAANAILTNYAMYVGGSPYFNINTTYGDTVGNIPNTSSTVKYVAAVADSGSLGTSLSDGNIWTLVYNQLHSGALPVDPNGVYFVLTAPHVAETSGFLTEYCGWHTYNYYGSNNTPIKYAFVGNAAANLGACAAQSTSPNGDPAADGMVSVIAHELEEAATDPQLNAWYDSNGQEVGDKCAWTFGTLYSASGAWANMEIGTRNYLIQRNWVNASGGYCALTYGGATPSFTIAAAPGSQTVVAGQTTGNYTMTATGANGWSGTATYSVTGGLPAGAAAHVSGNLIDISTTSGATQAGSYTLTFSGTDGVAVHTATATLVVTAPAPTFNVSIAPASKTVTRPTNGSAAASYTVTVTATTGYNGIVNLTVAGATTGLSLTLTPAAIQHGNGTALLTAMVTNSSTKTTKTLTVTAKDTVTTKTATATLTVQ
jgi:hypothetical protein